MNTNFMKKAVMLTAVVGSLIMSSAFTTKEKPNLKATDEFMYIYAYPTKPNIDRIYISGAIHYSGEGVCKDPSNRNFFYTAAAAFKKHLKSDYNLEIYNWEIRFEAKTGSNNKIPSFGCEGFATNGETQLAKNAFIRKTQNEGRYEISDTEWVYSCE